MIHPQRFVYEVWARNKVYASFTGSASEQEALDTAQMISRVYGGEYVIVCEFDYTLGEPTTLIPGPDGPSRRWGVQNGKVRREKKIRKL